MKNGELSPADEQRLRETFSTIPFVGLLGLELRSLARGSAVLELPVREEFMRHQGILHGGATVSLVDTAAAFALLTVLPPGEPSVTVDITVHFLRPARSGQLTARARVIRAGRRLATLSVDVVDTEGIVVATALTTYARASFTSMEPPG